MISSWLAISVVEALDGVVPVGLLLLQLVDCHLDVGNVFLDDNSFLLKVLLVGSCLHSCLLGPDQLVLGLAQGDLKVSLLAGALVLPLVVLRQVTLLGPGQLVLGL